MRREEDGGDRKAPKQSQIVRLLIIGRLQLRANQGRIELANKANFRLVASGVVREA